MFEKIIVGDTLICFVVCIQGCYSKYVIQADEFEDETEYKVLKIVTADDEVFHFAKGASIVDDRIEGSVIDGTFVRVPIEDVEYAQTYRFNTTNTVLFVLGGALVLCGVIVILVGDPVSDIDWEE